MLLVKGVKTVPGSYRTGQSDVSKLRGRHRNQAGYERAKQTPRRSTHVRLKLSQSGRWLVIEQPFLGCYHPSHETKGLVCVVDLDVAVGGLTTPCIRASPPCITGPAGRPAKQTAGRQMAEIPVLTAFHSPTMRRTGTTLLATNRLIIQSWASWLGHRELKK